MVSLPRFARIVGADLATVQMLVDAGVLSGAGLCVSPAGETRIDLNAFYRRFALRPRSENGAAH